MKNEKHPMRKIVNLSRVWCRVIEKQTADLGLSSIQSRMPSHPYFESRCRMKVLEKNTCKKNQTARGALSKYADPKLWEQEKTAWEKAVIEKHGSPGPLIKN